MRRSSARAARDVAAAGVVVVVIAPSVHNVAMQLRLLGPKGLVIAKLVKTKSESASRPTIKQASIAKLLWREARA